MINKMDYDFFKQLLTFIMLNTVLISSAYGKNGECYRKLRNGRSYDVFCCANYEEKNGTCITCGKGYFSKGGGSCTPCTGNVYGDKCLYSCSCTEYQICNNIVGCTDLQSTRAETTVKDDTRGETNETKDGTVPSKVIYSVCIGCVFIVIIVCGILFKRTRNKRSNPTKKHNKQQNDIQKVQNLELPSKMNMIELESIYDEIDEVSIKVTIVDSSLSKRHTNINSELSSDEISESEHDNIKNEHDEDYLNPYQPIIQDFVKHDYETVRESFNNIDRIENISHNGNEENSSEKTEQVHECLID